MSDEELALAPDRSSVIDNREYILRYATHMLSHSSKQLRKARMIETTVKAYQVMLLLILVLVLSVDIFPGGRVLPVSLSLGAAFLAIVGYVFDLDDKVVEYRAARSRAIRAIDKLRFNDEISDRDLKEILTELRGIGLGSGSFSRNI